MASDANGNIYLTGHMVGTGVIFDTVHIINPDPLGGNTEIYVAKFDGNGYCLWGTSAGGTNVKRLSARRTASEQSYGPCFDEQQEHHRPT